MAQALYIRRGWNWLYLDELYHIPTYPTPLMSGSRAIEYYNKLLFFRRVKGTGEKVASYAAFYDLLPKIISHIIWKFVGRI